MRIITSGMMVVAALSFVGCASTSGSNTAKLISVSEKIHINAPVSAVWAKVQNFGDLGAWHPAVAKTEIVGGTNNQKGAVRMLTLQDGGTIQETLTAYDVKAKTYSYIINKGVLPVSAYASTIQVLPTASGSEVTWRGRFKRKDVSANPAKGADDATATNTIQAVYKGGLENLKRITE